jgi:hypothetical protein
MVKRLKVAEAAAIMGVHPSFLRHSIRDGSLTFGYCFKKSSEYTFYINPAQFAEYMRISMEQLEEMLADQSIMNKA